MILDVIILKIIRAKSNKHFSVAFKQDEYKLADNFFRKFGGFSKFVKMEMQNNGYNNVNDLL